MDGNGSLYDLGLANIGRRKRKKEKVIQRSVNSEKQQSETIIDLRDDYDAFFFKKKNIYQFSKIKKTKSKEWEIRVSSISEMTIKPPLHNNPNTKPI